MQRDRQRPRQTRLLEAPSKLLCLAANTMEELEGLLLSHAHTLQPLQRRELLLHGERRLEARELLRALSELLGGGHVLIQRRHPRVGGIRQLLLLRRGQ